VVESQPNATACEYEVVDRGGQVLSLDGMRGTCILLVLASHTVGSSKFPRFYFLGGLATIGLVVFFVHSELLITTALMREQERTGTISLKNFYIRRFLRIFPVTYLDITVVALLSFLGIIGLRPHDQIAFYAAWNHLRIGRSVTGSAADGRHPVDGF
jgi:peptidoglycan/LPS O-acetylase OafA/YrhL